MYTGGVFWPGFSPLINLPQHAVTKKKTTGKLPAFPECLEGVKVGEGGVWDTENVKVLLSPLHICQEGKAVQPCGSEMVIIQF